MIPALILPDGRRVELDADVVLGRAPVAPEWSPSARSISVSVPTISKTHALIGHDADGVWLVDLHSSNGSESLDGAGVSKRAVPGQRLSIPTGSHIRVGTDTIITIDSGAASDDEDLDRTLVMPVATATPPTPPSARAADPTEPVDWSAVTNRNQVVPAAPERPAPSIAPQPVPPQPAPPHPVPRQPVPPQPAPPSAVRTQEFPAVPGNAGPPTFDHRPAPATAGRSMAHLIGAVVVLVWSAVGFANVRGWTPDAVFDAVDGRLIGFFFVPDRFTLQFAEFFASVRIPDSLTFLARGGDIGPIVAIITAIVALVVPTRWVRWILVGLVAIPMVLLLGLTVTFASDSIDFFIDEIDRLVPWFVLPGIGSLLLLWPGGRSAPAPTQPAATHPFAQAPPQDVFYAPGQPPAPPSAGPGAPPFS